MRLLQIERPPYEFLADVQLLLFARDSWLIQQLVTGLGYTHLADHVFALTHTNFATQLEAHGLWHWAIFVMLHLRDPARRRAAVQDLLLRHIEIDDTSEYAQREQFLKEELGISSVWIHQAKAIKSRINKRYLTDVQKKNIYIYIVKRNLHLYKEARHETFD